MTCSGYAVVSGLFCWLFRKIKRGPRGPMHTARMWMASATPGGAPGYDDDKKFGNNITHLTARTSQRLRGTYCPSFKSQATGAIGAEKQLSGVFNLRRAQFAGSSHARPVPPSVIPGRAKREPGISGFARFT